MKPQMQNHGKHLTQTFDARNIRVSDLEINTRVILPKGRDYININCSEKGEQRSNLTRDELVGLISLKKRLEVW